MKTCKICKIAFISLLFLTFNNLIYSQFTPLGANELITEKRVGIGYPSTGIGDSSVNFNILKSSTTSHNIKLKSIHSGPDLYFEFGNSNSQIALYHQGIRFRINGDETMFLYKEGTVRIGGVVMPKDSNGNLIHDYKLVVKDGILTEKVKVAIKGTSNWSDYVFDENYNLNSLNKVEKYLKKNKHLPNVPSADEVVENGINLGEMDATLLRQIEELWLHTIELNKEKNNLENTVEKLVKRVAKLEKN